MGWAEIDALGSGPFTAAEMLAKWNEWARAIYKLSKSKNINARRASLVLLVRPLQASGDERLLDLSLEIASALAHEEPIVITKAISLQLCAAARSTTRKKLHRTSAKIPPRCQRLPCANPAKN